MFHCHNLVHEDHDMMRAYVTVGGAGLDNLPVLNPSTVLLVNQAAGKLTLVSCLYAHICAQHQKA